MIYIIVAMEKKQIIGNNNQLPWKIKSELKFFKEQTINKNILMGRKTFESLPKILPNRHTIVLTRDVNFKVNHENVEVINDIKEVLLKFKNSKEILYICGGSEIYKLFLPYVDKLIISQIRGNYKGDTYFPTVTWNEFQIIDKKIYDEFIVTIYKRK
ncbi:dihydrofolate reductase [Spiroplasma endosymbiont of Amphibalanus improvisus]|uniref:dihydrofolate reductase n=1 Tax=Spiroplasma endosymbiont of Amphibalanus improvisus TaxID=3066327 RepID=UPI00313E6DD4